MLLVYTSFLEETVVELAGFKVTRGEIGALFLLSISVIWHQQQRQGNRG